ncbi:MAG: FadR family transcriptional regulator [Tindallia sp. MSAO_Bac2]|nr:MAG: FadR family transcriptional regulator [Tindallia sp. MSAO_Bac2]
MFEQVKTKRVYQQIVDQIKGLLKKGELKPGDKLNSERELAETLGVSRASVREALAAMEHLGILETRQGEGTFIADHYQKPLIEPFLIMTLMDPEANMELLEVRKILEVQAVELATLRCDEEDLEKLETYIELMEKDLGRNILGEENDASFHFCIAEATKNRALIRIMHTISDSLEQSMRRGRYRLFAKRGNAEKLYDQHLKIFEGIRSRDPEKAKEAMLSHLSFVVEELKSMESSNDVQDKG